MKFLYLILYSTLCSSYIFKSEKKTTIKVCQKQDNKYICRNIPFIPKSNKTNSIVLKKGKVKFISKKKVKSKPPKPKNKVKSKPPKPKNKVKSIISKPKKKNVKSIILKPKTNRIPKNNPIPKTNQNYFVSKATFYFRIGNDIEGCPSVQTFNDGNLYGPCNNGGGIKYTSQSKYWAAIGNAKNKCGQTITVKYNNNFLNLQIMDNCEACVEDNHVDMSLDALVELTGSKEIACSIGRPQPIITWWFN
jgi:hypothetical protein